jgi:hypothetical protein
VSEEHAAGQRGMSAYPQSWGFPVGDAESEERTSWVLRNVAFDRARSGSDGAAVRSSRVALAKADELRRQHDALTGRS